MLAHLPLAGAVAAMGAAMLDLVEHPHDRNGPAPAVWLLSAGTAVVLATTMAIAASLQAWHTNRARYRPLAISCALVALLCLVLAAMRPAPIVLVCGLVILLSVPWVVAVSRSTTDRVQSFD